MRLGNVVTKEGRRRLTQGWGGVAHPRRTEALCPHLRVLVTVEKSTCGRTWVLRGSPDYFLTQDPPGRGGDPLGGAERRGRLSSWLHRQVVLG